MCNRGILILLVGFISSFLSLHAQSTAYQLDSIPELDSISRIKKYIPGFDFTTHVKESNFLISSLVVTGNKKTKSNIIGREVPFRAGMQFQLGDLIDLFQRGEQQLMNTTLFHSARIFVSRFEGKIGRAHV